MNAESEHDHGDSFLATTIVALARFCGQHPRLILAAVLLSCVASGAFTATQLSYHTHRNDLISKQKDYYQRWKNFTKEFGEDADLVAVVEGSRRETMIAALDDIARRVNEHPADFDRLHYKVDLRPLRDRALLFLPTEQIRAIQDHLKNMSMLIDPPVIGFLDPLAGWRRLTFFELMDKSALVNGPLNPEQKFQPEKDPLLRQLSVLVKNVRSFITDSATYESPWRNFLPGMTAEKDMMAEPLYFFSDDGSLAFLTVRPASEISEGFTFSEKSITLMRTILKEAEASHPGVRIGLTGIPVLENDEMVSTQTDSTSASWYALVGVALLYLAVYRGFRYPFMTVAALIVGTIWALGWLTMTVGHLNILSSAFAVMLLGMGDYGVLWVTRFGQERAAGADMEEANRATAAGVGPSVFTAAVTTALSFFATMLADLKAVAELGWIAGCGVLLCAISCFTVMPALLALFDCQAKRTQTILLPIQEAREQRRRWLPALMARPGLVLAVSLGGTIVLGYFACLIPYDHNLLNLQSPSLPSVQWQHKVLDKTPEGNIYATSITNTPEEALALKERYEQLPLVSRVVEVASLVPLGQNQKLEFLEDIQARLRKLPPRGTVVPYDTPDAASLVRAADRLLGVIGPWQQLRPSPFLGEFNDNLQHLRNLLASPQGPLLCEKLRQYQARIGQDLMEDLHRLRDVSHAAPITVADLPTSMKERHIGYTGKWMVAVFSKKCLWDYDNLQEFVAQVRTVDAEATGRPFSILEGLRAMRNGFLWAGVYALIAMVMILLLDFGSAKHTLVALAPLAMGMIVALGCLSLLGFSLNPANLIAFPLILGVGADNGVHVLHDYRGRKPGTRYSLSHSTGRGIMVAALTTILGFGTLMIAQHRGLASLGVALALGVTACMVTALVVLPAFLGMWSERRNRAVNSVAPRSRAA